jgi:rSAM/selenodomain-associated transferase 1
MTNGKVAAVIVCKTPIGGLSKTRLSPPLLPEQCARISECFIRDLSRSVQTLVNESAVSGVALYTPQGSEADLQSLLPAAFRLHPQGDGDLGARLSKGSADLFGEGYKGVILINSDSPTLPLSILRNAADAVIAGDRVVLGPAIDGGYTLIGLSRPHPQLFDEIPWSTPAVHSLTVRRASEIGVPVLNLAPWYDVDDADSLELLAAEMRGERPVFASPDLIAAEAPATRQFMRDLAFSGEVVNT